MPLRRGTACMFQQLLPATTLASLHSFRKILVTIRRSLGFLLQLIVLSLLPMLILWQLMFGFRLILMPALTLLGIFVFMIGHKLREG